MTAAPHARTAPARVADIMTRDPTTVAATASVQEALWIMDRGGFHHVPVMSDGRLVGMLTSSDAAPWTLGPADDDVEVRKVMTPRAITVPPDLPVSAALAKMLGLKIGALLVIDGGELVGVLTCVDLLRFLASILDDQEGAHSARRSS